MVSITNRIEKMEEFEYLDFKTRTVQILCKPWNTWKYICARFNRTYSIFFNTLGRTVALYPWVTIAFVVMVTCGTGWGVRDLNLDNDSESLYSSKGAASWHELAVYRRSFETIDYKSSFIIITKQENGNVLQSKIMDIAREIHEKIMNESGFRTVCLRSTNNTSHCLHLNPLEMISTNHRREQRDWLSQDLTHASKNDTLIMSNDQPASVNVKNSFGKFLKYDYNGQIVSAPVMRFVYIQNGYGHPRLQQIEFESNFMSIVSEARRKYANQEIDIFFSTMQIDQSSALENLKSMLWYYFAALATMVFFAWACYVKPNSFKKSHGVLMCSGVFVVVMAIICSLGLLGISGAMFTKVVIVLPFVILGIAIDDIFIIVDTFDRLDDKMNVEDRIAMTMEDCGVTITMTTLTDLIAFLIGSKSSFPAVSYFCIYGFTFLLISYLFIVTMFIALLTLEARWHQNRDLRLFDCLKCCKKSSMHANELKNAVKLEVVNEDEATTQSLADKIMHKYGVFLMQKSVKISVVCFSILVIAGSCYFAPKISLDFDVSMLMKSDSMAKFAYDTTNKYYSDYSSVAVVIHSCNNHDLNTLAAEFTALPSVMLENTKDFELKPNSLVEHFPNWVNEAKLLNISLIQHLKVVLQEKKFSRFNRDFNWNTTQASIDHIKFDVIMKSDITSEEKAKAMKEIRKFVSDYFKCPALATSRQFVYLEQFSIVEQQTAYSLVVCGIAVLAVTSVFVTHPGIILLLLVSFGVMLVCLFAVMYIWNVWLNIVSMVVLLMALGFTVDYSCHIVLTFAQSRKPTSDEKIIEALGSTGASVIMGGFTTGLAAIILGFTNASITIFFFKLLVSIVSLGLINGLVILPVYLSLLFTESGKIKQRKKLTLKMLPSMLATPMPGHDQKFLFYADTPTVIPMTPKQINETSDSKQRFKQPALPDRFKYT